MWDQRGAGLSERVTKEDIDHFQPEVLVVAGTCGAAGENFQQTYNSRACSSNSTLHSFLFISKRHCASSGDTQAATSTGVRESIIFSDRRMPPAAAARA
jgi:hypothetical protein